MAAALLISVMQTWVEATTQTETYSSIQGICVHIHVGDTQTNNQTSSPPEANSPLTKSFHSRTAPLSLAPRESARQTAASCFSHATVAVDAVMMSLFCVAPGLSTHMRTWNKWIRKQCSLEQRCATSSCTTLDSSHGNWQEESHSALWPRKSCMS